MLVEIIILELNASQTPHPSHGAPAPDAHNVLTSVSASRRKVELAGPTKPTTVSLRTYNSNAVSLQSSSPPVPSSLRINRRQWREDRKINPDARLWIGSHTQTDAKMSFGSHAYTIHVNLLQQFAQATNTLETINCSLGNSNGEVVNRSRTRYTSTEKVTSGMIQR